MDDNKSKPTEKKVNKPNTRSQIQDKEEKLKQIEADIKNAKKLKKEIKKEISYGKIRVGRKEERRIDALVGVAVRWASYADAKLQKRIMEILDQFYFDDHNRSFLGLDLLPTEKKTERENAREEERKRRKESTGNDTNPVRITKTPQQDTPIETPAHAVEVQAETSPDDNSTEGNSGDKIGGEENTPPSEEVELEEADQSAGGNKDKTGEKADSAPDVKICPNCGSPLKLKMNRRDGTKFWGCSKFSDGCDFTAKYIEK